jgi:hypothetical protein
MPDIDAILAEIRRLYYETTRGTIERDLSRAVALLKSMPDEDARQRAAVYMDGLAQMKGEWLSGRGTTTRPRPRPGRGRSRR